MSADIHKYRVWDNKNNEYVPEEEYHCLLRRDGTLDCGVAYDDGYAGGIYWVETEDATVEHCTGRKDRNGKLIYKGDVVVVPNQYPYFDYADGVQHKSLNDTYGVIEHDAVPNYVGIVEWDDESAQFVIVLQCVNPSKSGISDGDCRYFDEEENFEIIGNVHEMEVEKMRDCESCHGTGYLKSRCDEPDRICPICNGTGRDN